MLNDRSTDPHTVALWLFDEPQYLNMTLTDAGPHQLDLRLLAGGRLAPGRFGNALWLSGDPLPAVEYACPTTTLYTVPAEQRTQSARPPEKFNIGYSDWTWEFWYRATAAQTARATIWELTNLPYDVPAGTNALLLDTGSTQFILRSTLLKLDLAIPTHALALTDGGWHHLAFTFGAAERQVRHYVDGKRQPLPARGGFLPLSGLLAAFAIGRSIDGTHPLTGMLDEMCLSDVVRYDGDFAVPGSLSHNYGPAAPAPSRATGLPLLFAASHPDEPLSLGTRKHVFIDDVLLQSREGIHFSANPPGVREVTDFHCDKPWESGPRFGPGIPDVLHVYDNDDEIRLIYTNGGMWGGKRDAICMATSQDGLSWEKPELGVVSWDGTTRNNILLDNATQGTLFRDPNPDAPADERYKYVALLMYRGIYVFLSPDGIHWRRNETISLPIDCGGGCETFWDDQRGLYATMIRHEGLWTHLQRGPGRACALAQTRELLKPWPFQPQEEPGVRRDVFILPSVTEELPIAIGPDAHGRQVYRSKAVKYPWAPDVYLGFPWRYQPGGNVRPGSDLAVSRDGEHWSCYGDPLYLGPDWEIGGRKVVEALVDHGLVRRGDEIWQYATARFTAHGGAAYGGEEYDSGIHDRLVRLTQRLDGFTSLDADPEGGVVLTRPLVLSGQKLILNVAARGFVRVAITDEDCRPIPGFSAAECDPIHTDSLSHPVTWRGQGDLRELAGRVVRLQLQLADAKLYALQFLAAPEQ